MHDFVLGQICGGFAAFVGIAFANGDIEFGILFYVCCLIMIFIYTRKNV